MSPTTWPETLALFAFGYSLAIAWHHASRLAHEIAEEPA